MSIEATQESKSLLESLNAVYLPPAFCALWHLDTNDIEFIWPSLVQDEDLNSRSFDIYYDEQTVRCEWADPSERLIAIAYAVRKTQEPPSEANYRNIVNFRQGIEFRRKNSGASVRMGRPLSFWIRNVLGDMDAAIRMCQHINFYMRYYDALSPLISIVDETQKRKSVVPKRYPRGIFPSKLMAFKINPYVLDLWFTASSTRDPFRKFLHSYQILEYYAFYHVKSEVTDAVRRIMLKPDAMSRVDEVTMQVIEELSKEKMEDVHKMRAIIRDCIDPTSLWSVIETDRDAFDAATQFDGGFVLEPLFGGKIDFETFKGNWQDAFGNRLETLRNVIAHSREKRNSTSISPTRANHERLLPWATLTLRAAEEVMIYQRR